MAQALAIASAAIYSDKDVQHEFVTLCLGGQLFGISVMAVQDVMHKQLIAPIPLAATVIAGSLNVRGRIVTALDMRSLLGLKTYPEPEKVMKIVVDYNHELYALIVDKVGEVISLPMNEFEKPPANLDASWCGLTAGVFKLEHELLIILDVGSIIERVSP